MSVLNVSQLTHILAQRAYSLDLPLHGDTKQDEEVHEENGPIDWHIAELSEGTAERDENGLGR